MHYCLLMLTKSCPSDEMIDEILKPYNSDDCWKAREENPDFEMPKFTWDWWQVGGRYNGKLKLKFDANSKDGYRWAFLALEPRTGRLFRSYLLEHMMSKERIFREDDYFCSMGARDGYIYVDGAPIADLIDFDAASCFCFLDVDGTAYARKTWDGDELIKDPSFDETVTEICKNRTDCFATVIDIHD